MRRPAEGVVAMELPSRKPRRSMPPSRPPQSRQARALSSLQVGMEAVLEATVSVPWERPVHTARLAFLRRVAQPGEVSVHMACGTDRLGFIDAAYGLTTILTDVDSASLNTLAQQFAEFAARCGPLPGTLQCRQLPVEGVTSEDGIHTWEYPASHLVESLQCQPPRCLRLSPPHRPPADRHRARRQSLLHDRLRPMCCCAEPGLDRWD